MTIDGNVRAWNEKLGLKLGTMEETFGDAARRILELKKSLLSKTKLLDISR